jgi:hypothetical protein
VIRRIIKTVGETCHSAPAKSSERCDDSSSGIAGSFQRQAGDRRRTIIEFMHEERLSRQQAAERLADIAYALSLGGTLELRTKGKLVKVPVSDEVFLRRESRTGPDHAAVEVGLIWFV